MDLKHVQLLDPIELEKTTLETNIDSIIQKHEIKKKGKYTYFR